MCEDPFEHQNVPQRVDENQSGGIIRGGMDQSSTESENPNFEQIQDDDLGCIIVDVQPLNPDGSWADGIGPQTYGPLAMPWYTTQSWGLDDGEYGTFNEATSAKPYHQPWDSFWIGNEYHDY